MPSAREVLLATARNIVVAGDWERTPLAEVAARAGVSRQTVYKEFGSKDGLAQALSATETQLFLAELATVLEAHPHDPVAGTRAAVAHTLRTGADDPLLKAILSSARGPSELLPLLTTRAEPMLEAARKLLTGYLTEHWPHLTTRDVSLVAESTIRLTVSHLVLPLAPIERTADDLATLVERLLPAEPTGHAEPGEPAQTAEQAPPLRPPVRSRSRSRTASHAPSGTPSKAVRSAHEHA